ncbi:IcmT/TraK family protein [Gluconobacter oxydans]|uniref:IcmT/TraK family protein n=1 Tax=Gluconobacter oxydans TaxID=442 RepID=UPI0026491070|nr:IcmT/TraK family protein [Gluconobacter oxydans]WKE49678.1 IcmT/TraK family protein [Gluconobacter oxydans]
MWRATAQPVRLAILDGRACLPLLVTISYWSWTTLYIGFFGTVVFVTISFFGLTLPAAMRTLRRLVTGPIRTGRPTWKRRRYG